MYPFLILFTHLLIYGIPPLLIAKHIQKFNSMAIFYTYFGFLFVFTQLYAIFYSIIFSENLIITGGNISYCSLILLVFIVAILSNNPAVVRNSILIGVLLNVFLFFLYFLLYSILDNSSILNIFQITPVIFRTTISVNLMSLSAYVIELILMFSIFKIVENFNLIFALLIPVYVVVYIGILCFDGFIFPFVLKLLEPDLGSAITGGFLGKFILGLGYTPFLLLFLILFREDVKQYMKKPFDVRYIIMPPRQKLLEDLKKSEERYFEAHDRANFYRDLLLHDMSNIIQNISFSIELHGQLRKEGKELSLEKLDELHEIIRNQINAAKILVSNIKKLFSLENEMIALSRINLLEYLDQAIQFVRQSFQGKELNIQVHSFKENIEVRANEFLIDVIQNILTNAIKYNDSDIPQVIINISEFNSDLIKMEFIDNGIGISDELKEKIFLKGYQKLKGEKGMGLGLSLVYKIIDFYKGKIWVENRVNEDSAKGSNFVLLIPKNPAS